MNVKLKHSTPLHICSDAIRGCWQSQDASDTQEAVDQYITDSILDSGFCGATDHIIGEKDKALIDRVGNKFKHASTLEHLRICVSIDNQVVAQTFKENKYSDVTFVDNVYVISTNVRAMQAIDIPMNIKLLMLPEEYKYLFQ